MLFSFFCGDAVRNCPPQTGNVSFNVVTSNIFGVFVWIILHSLQFFSAGTCGAGIRSHFCSFDEA